MQPVLLIDFHEETEVIIHEVIKQGLLLDSEHLHIETEQYPLH